MSPDKAPDDVSVEAALTEWRRRAVNALLVAITIVTFPVLVLNLTGQGPPFTAPMAITAVALYAAIAWGAVFRRVNYQVRMWTALSSGYLLATIGGIAIPDGPFVRSLPISLSVMALVFLGARAGRIATAIGVVILLGAPFLALVPGVVQALVTEPPLDRSRLGVTLTQSLGLTATLVPLMILMARFHSFLIQSLASERTAAARLAREGELRRRLEREMARIGDEERRRLGQDVHDGVCQQLTGALLRCQALERGLSRGEALPAAAVAALSGLLEEAIDEAHAVAQGLQPLGDYPGGLAPALRALAGRTRTNGEIECRFTTSGKASACEPATAHHLYRIAQEALSNAVRHAHARRISVDLHACAEHFVLRVEDDGVGIPPDIPEGRMGLKTMAYRAQVMDGDLAVERVPSGGTRITCRVPRATRAMADGRNSVRGEPAR